MIKTVFVAVSAFLLPFAQVHGASVCFMPHGSEADTPRAWAYEVGVALITPNSIENFIGIKDRVKRAKGPAGGEVYALTASRRLGELQIESFGNTFTPQLELPFTIDLINENSRSPYFDASLSFTVRWVDFPWNDSISMSFAMGVGFSYSQRVYLMDKQRHPEDLHRSKIKFNWPIQLTFAHPDHPDHQVMLFIQHHSGGHVFDHGGVNHIGMGYRFGF